MRTAPASAPSISRHPTITQLACMMPLAEVPPARDAIPAGDRGGGAERLARTGDSEIAGVAHHLLEHRIGKPSGEPRGGRRDHREPPGRRVGRGRTTRPRGTRPSGSVPGTPDRGAHVHLEQVGVAHRRDQFDRQALRRLDLVAEQRRAPPDRSASWRTPRLSVAHGGKVPEPPSVVHCSHDSTNRWATHTSTSASPIPKRRVSSTKGSSVSRSCLVPTSVVSVATGSGWATRNCT